ncbi:MAG: hypothetical protein ACI9A1_000786, partial [Lentimonas sp.]
CRVSSLIVRNFSREAGHRLASLYFFNMAKVADIGAACGVYNLHVSCLWLNAVTHVCFKV